MVEGPNGRERQVRLVTHGRTAAENPAKTGLHGRTTGGSLEVRATRDRTVCGEAGYRKLGARRTTEGGGMRARESREGLGSEDLPMSITDVGAAWTPAAETTQPSPCRPSQQSSWPPRMCAPTAGRGCWRDGRSKSEHDTLTRENRPARGWRFSARLGRSRARFRGLPPAVANVVVHRVGV